MKDIKNFLYIINEDQNLTIEDIKEYVEYIYNYGFDKYFDKIKNENFDLKSRFRYVVNYPKYGGALFFNLGMLDYIVYAGKNNEDLDKLCNKVIDNFNSYSSDSGMSKNELVKVLSNTCKYLK